MMIILPMLLACASPKLLRLENSVLRDEVHRLEEDLAKCSSHSIPDDFSTKVDQRVVLNYLSRTGLPSPEVSPSGLITTSIDGKNTSYRLNIQLFDKEQILYMSIADYLTIQDADSSQAMVLLLTQLAAANYELLLGKYQLDMRSGAITLSMELNLDDGLGFKTFNSVVHHLIKTADQKYPDLIRVAQGTGI